MLLVTLIAEPPVQMAMYGGYGRYGRPRQAAVAARADLPWHSSVRPSYGVLVAGRPVVLGEPELVRNRKNREYRLRARLAAFAPLVDLTPGATASAMTAAILLEPGTPGVPPAPLIVLDLADGRTTTYTFRASAYTMKTTSR